jgi:hypothetical protein
MNEHRGHIILAGAICTGKGRMAVGCRIGLPWAETALAVAGDPGEIGIHILQIGDDRQRRVEQAIKVQSVKADARQRSTWCVPLVQPIGKGADHLVAPHPRGEAGKACHSDGGVSRWRT